MTQADESVLSSQGEGDVRRLYLDLLKRSITNTIRGTEPDVDQPIAVKYVAEAIDHYQKSDAVSMLPLVRMDNIEYCIANVLRDDVPGDFIETGVWRGGASIFARGVLKAYGAMDRRVWVADSFEGLPEPDPEKFPLEAKAFRSSAMTKHYKHFAVGVEQVKSNFAAYELLDDKVVFLKGWFKDSLPTAPIEKIAIMRLDGDHYDSTMDGLVNLYDKLSVGGYVIIDDYGEDDWTYCRKAVEDFRSSRGLTEPLCVVDRRCSYWRRER